MSQMFYAFSYLRSREYPGDSDLADVNEKTRKKQCRQGRQNELTLMIVMVTTKQERTSGQNLEELVRHPCVSCLYTGVRKL